MLPNPIIFNVQRYKSETTVTIKKPEQANAPIFAW